MALFFRLQFFFQLRHLLPLSASPHHFLWCCSSTLPPYLTELRLHLMGNRSLGHPLRGGVWGISFKICLINRCPQSFSSTGTFSSGQALALRASSPGALLGALLLFLGARSNVKLPHLLTCASNNCSVLIQLQATEWSCPENCWTHSDHQGYYCVWNTIQMQVWAQTLKD